MSVLPTAGEPPGTVTTFRLSPWAHPAAIPTVAATARMMRMPPRASVRTAVSFPSSGQRRPRTAAPRLLAGQPRAEQHGGPDDIGDASDRPHDDSGHLLVGQGGRHAVVRIGRQ